MRVLVLIAAWCAAGCDRAGTPAAPAPEPRPADGSGSPPFAPPARVVSLSPSATELVAALGATELLVGVDSYSKFPPEVSALPKVGDYLHPNLEVIVRLRPTLVIADDVHAQVAASLRDAGVPTVICPIHTLHDVEAGLAQIAAPLGRAARAAQVTAEMEAALDAARARRPARHPRVLLVLDRDADDLGHLVAAAPGSYVDELLAIVGGDNVLAASPSPYPKIATEEILRAHPDVIVDLSYAARSGLGAWSGLAVPAVTAHRVVAISDDELLAPSPRVGAALAALVHAVSP